MDGLGCKKMRYGSENGLCPICSSCVVLPPHAKDILRADQLEQQEKYINQIRGYIRKGHAALVTGAGVSVPAGMPGWSALISRMMGYAIQYNQLSQKPSKRTLLLVNAMVAGKLSLFGSVNPLESAEYVAQYFDDKSFSEDVRDLLPETSMRIIVSKTIDKAHPLPAGKRRVPRPEAEAREIGRQNTLCAAAYLLYSQGGLRKAMTYNYDPLIQEQLLDVYGLQTKCLLTQPGKWNSVKPDCAPDDLREIYHVHGFVAGKRHRRFQAAYPEESGPLILSEDSYYRVEKNEAYSWSSSIQSEFLNRYYCIFVGFSAEDYNFRRIVRQRSQKRDDSKHPHYLILSIDTWIRDIFEAVCKYHLNEQRGTSSATLNQIECNVREDATLLLQFTLESRRRYWERFGIHPIWAVSAEIPALLVDLVDESTCL